MTDDLERQPLAAYPDPAYPQDHLVPPSAGPRMLVAGALTLVSGGMVGAALTQPWLLTGGRPARESFILGITQGPDRGCGPVANPTVLYEYVPPPGTRPEPAPVGPPDRAPVPTRASAKASERSHKR